MLHSLPQMDLLQLRCFRGEDIHEAQSLNGLSGKLQQFLVELGIKLSSLFPHLFSPEL